MAVDAGTWAAVGTGCGVGPQSQEVRAWPLDWDVSAAVFFRDSGNESSNQRRKQGDAAQSLKDHIEVELECSVGLQSSGMGSLAGASSQRTILSAVDHGFSNGAPGVVGTVSGFTTNFC